MQSEQDFTVKILIVGDQGVGKTSLLHRYCHGRFEGNIAPTIGFDFVPKDKKINGVIVKLQLWDIAGQERYKAISKMFVRGAHGCIVVADATDRESLAESIKWKQLIEEHFDNDKKVAMIFVQNKFDTIQGKDNLDDYQTEIYLEDFARENKFSGFMQASAKDGHNVDKIFDTITQEIIDQGIIDLNRQLKESQIDQENIQKLIQDTEKLEKKDGSCC